MNLTTEYERATASLSTYGFFASGTLGKSMRPLFREGRDVVIVKQCITAPRKYDVVLYGRGGKCVLHRVIKKRGDMNIIRGDNTYNLEYIPDSQIIGILIEYDRGKKHHTVDEFGYKFYSRFWNFIYPFRFFFIYVSRLCAKIVRKLFRTRR